MKNLRKIALVLGVLMCVLFAGCTKDGHVADKVSVMNVDIGGMSRDEAIKTLNSVKMNGSEKVQVNVDGTAFTLTAEDIGAEYDVEKTVDMVIDKSKDMFSGMSETTYQPYVKVNMKKLDQALINNLGDKETLVVETSARVVEDGIEVTNGTSGVQVDRAKAAELICAELEKAQRSEIKLAIVKTAPKKLDANKLLSGFEGDYKEAEYILEADGTITVTDSSAGCEIDMSIAKEEMKAHTKEGEVYVIPCSVNMPPFSSEDMREHLLGDTLATFTTNFSSSSANRCENIRLASESINGIVMMPGDVFSFNEALGERTTARGYKPAGAYVAGKTVTEVGGGICQVSSTLYNTVLLSNLEIVERRSHQMTVSYVRVGRDATVNWGTTDFKFKNNTGHPIKLVSEVEGKNITISILGFNTIPDMRVEILTNTVSVIAPTEEIVEDPEKEVGYTNTKKGSNGYVVDAVRVVYSGNEEISRETLTRSRYNPTKTIVTIGTKGAELTPEGGTLPGGEISPDEDTTMPPGLMPETETPEQETSDTGL